MNTHTPFLRPKMPKKMRLTPFSFNYFFGLSTRSPYPRYTCQSSFLGNFRPKMVKKLPKEEKKFFFLIFLFTFSLSPDYKKQYHLLFPPFFISGNGITARKNVPLNFFFFDFFAPYRSSCSKKITTYLFFRNSDLKCPKVPLGAPKFLFY